eukprot:TRINITY_DN4164_c0_g1_i1.p1 TRINITY_DN4164_c0_g1~~TRINITY_DN4164_c0_g1_i1.p1  ORF type:complete len:453 (-),score=67.86 TRINITY_DN4164_c0_g1_i1:49-1407(-)
MNEDLIECNPNGVPSGIKNYKMETPEAYKLRKELRLEQLEGSNIHSIALILFIVPVVSLVRRVVPLSGYLGDFVITVIPLLCSVVLVDYLVYIYLALFFLFMGGWSLRKKFFGSSKSQLAALENSRKPFLTDYRSAMMLLTCIAILAVDFEIFNLDLAKTETYGISLMDVGVGSFVISMSIVSKKSVSSVGRFKLFGMTLKGILPLLVLGIGRTLMVKSVNYQEHVSEYGVHWNFFLTLSSVSLFAAILDAPIKYSALIGIILSIIQQIALQSGLEHFILEGPRENIISANKEGLVSIIGYTALYLCSIQIGNRLRTASSRKAWIKVLIEICAITLIFIGVGMFLEYGLGIRPSRRMANITYCAYVLGLNMFMISGFLSLDLFTPPRPSIIFSSISKKKNSQLIVFIIANLMTGLINMSMKTLDIPDTLSFGILIIYCLILTAFSVYIKLPV